MEKDYKQYITDLKEQILQSRYHAAKLVNREMLLLYFHIGKSLSDKIVQENWGAKVVSRISEDLQKELPGLRGFSGRNLQKMRQFHDTYSDIDVIVPLSTAQLQSKDNQPVIEDPYDWFMKEDFIEKVFLRLGFTHHVLLINKCPDLKERRFYMEQTMEQQWTVSLLEYHIKSKLFHKKGTLPNNFKETLSANLYPKAIQAFRDEYLLDFISINEDDDEQVFEQEIVNN